MDGRKVVRIHYHFTGWVQGVGLRYTAKYAAQRLGLTGFVENEDDGSVTMEVQGLMEDIKSMFEAFDRNRWIRIEGISRREMPPDPRETGFEVRGF